MDKRVGKVRRIPRQRGITLLDQSFTFIKTENTKILCILYQQFNA